MSRLNMRIERLEASTGKGLRRSVLVFSDQEAEAVHQELGSDVILMHVQFIAPGGEVVPYDYGGRDYAWRINPPKFLRDREVQS